MSASIWFLSRQDSLRFLLVISLLSIPSYASAARMEGVQYSDTIRCLLGRKASGPVYTALSYEVFQQGSEAGRLDRLDGSEVGSVDRLNGLLEFGLQIEAFGTAQVGSVVTEAGSVTHERCLPASGDFEDGLRLCDKYSVTRQEEPNLKSKYLPTSLRRALKSSARNNDLDGFVHAC